MDSKTGSRQCAYKLIIRIIPLYLVITTTIAVVCMYHRGKVVSSAEEKEIIIYGDVDLDRLEEVRTSVPILKQKRQEVYKSATSVV